MLKTFMLVGMILCAVSSYSQEPVNPAELGTAPLTREGSARSNTLSYGVSSTNAFDDNVQGSGGKSNFTSLIQPQFGLAMNRPRLQANFNYSSGYTFSSTVASQSDISQSAGGQLQYLFSRRLSLSLRASFITTSNPLESVYADSVLPQVGVLERPSNPFAGARVHQTSELAGSDLVYRLAQYTSVGVGGSFSDSIYRTIFGEDNTLNQSLRSQSWSTHSYISHRLSPIYNIGMDYSARNFSSQQSGASTLTNTVLGFATVSLSPHVQLSLFAGPEFSNIHDAGLGISVQRFDGQASSLSFGSTLYWQGEHNGLGISFIQQVSDFAQTTGGAARARTVNFTADRQLTRRIKLNAFTTYFTSSPLGSFPAGLTPDSVIAGIGISRPVTRSITANVSAFHQEFLSPGLSTFAYPTHNVVSVSFSYNLTRPIGR